MGRSVCVMAIPANLDAASQGPFMRLLHEAAYQTPISGPDLQHSHHPQLLVIEHMAVVDRAAGKIAEAGA